MKDCYLQRLQSGFLFWPKTINGERRWLRWAEWTEVDTGFGWRPRCWDEPDPPDMSIFHGYLDTYVRSCRDMAVTRTRLAQYGESGAFLVVVDDEYWVVKIHPTEFGAKIIETPEKVKDL